MKHQKHTNLARRKNGNYAPNEMALLGAKCSIITNLVYKLSSSLSAYKLAYFDASHTQEVETNNIATFTFHPKGNVTISDTIPVNEYAQRIQFSQFDYVFINGNHYAGSEQVIFLDSEKETSINKRIDQITHIHFFIQLTEGIEPFQSIKDKFPNWKNIPSYSLHDLDKITEHFAQIIKKTIPSIKALVLTGGKSTRMGTDKSKLMYHGKPQKEFVKELLEKQGLDTFYSTRQTSDSPSITSEKSQIINQSTDKIQDCCPSGFTEMGLEQVETNNEIPDTFFNLGPFGGICSAFRKDPNSAWFVLATDLPFVNKELIELLLSKRNPTKVATTVRGKDKQFPEPLITIYEPRAYPLLLQYLAQGYSCPRKMIINADVEIVEVDDYLIQNINTPQEFEAAKKAIADSLVSQI